MHLSSNAVVTPFSRMEEKQLRGGTMNAPLYVHMQHTVNDLSVDVCENVRKPLLFSIDWSE